MPGDDPISISERQAERLARATLKIERLGDSKPSNAPAENWQFVKISSTSMTSGMYPGHWFEGNAQAGWTQKAVIWIDTPNGEALSMGVYYQAKQVKKHVDGKAIFQTDRVAPSGITIKDDYGTTLTNISTLNLFRSALISGESPTGQANLQGWWAGVTDGTTVADAGGFSGPSGVTEYSQAANVWVRNGVLWVNSGSGVGTIRFPVADDYSEAFSPAVFVTGGGSANSPVVRMGLSYYASDSYPSGDIRLYVPDISTNVNAICQINARSLEINGPVSGGAATIKVYNGLALQTGYTGTVAGMTFVCGVYISGSPSSGTITIGTTGVTGGTTNGVTYTDGSVIRAASDLLIDSSGRPNTKIGSNYARAGEASF